MDSSLADSKEPWLVLPKVVMMEEQKVEYLVDMRDEIRAVWTVVSLVAQMAVELESSMVLKMVELSVALTVLRSVVAMALYWVEMMVVLWDRYIILDMNCSFFR